jgi:MFS transporter, ACS family, DAL5 transporter family protein
MTIPVYVLGAASLIAIVYVSDRFQKRGLVIIGCCVPVALGYLVCVATPNPHAGYAGMFILVIGWFPPPLRNVLLAEALT